MSTVDIIILAIGVATIQPPMTLSYANVTVSDTSVTIILPKQPFFDIYPSCVSFHIDIGPLHILFDFDFDFEISPKSKL